MDHINVALNSTIDCDKKENENQTVSPGDEFVLPIPVSLHEKLWVPNFVVPNALDATLAATPSKNEIFKLLVTGELLYYTAIEVTDSFNL